MRKSLLRTQCPEKEEDACLICIQSKAHGVDLNCELSCDDEKKTKELKRKIESLEKELEECEGDCDEEEEEEEVVEIEEENNGAIDSRQLTRGNWTEQIADDLEAERRIRYWNQLLDVTVNPRPRQKLMNVTVYFNTQLTIQ